MGLYRNVLEKLGIGNREQKKSDGQDTPESLLVADRIRRVIIKHCRFVIDTVDLSKMGNIRNHIIESMSEKYIGYVASQMAKAFEKLDSNVIAHNIEVKHAGYNYIISAIGTLNLPSAAKSFPPFYLEWMQQKITEKLDSGDTDPIIHWIGLSEDAAATLGIHLTIYDPPHAFVALDLLSPSEMRDLGFLPDRRPLDVSQQWNRGWR